MNFWKIFFASLAALIVGSVVITIVSIMFGVSLMTAFNTDSSTTSERSVLCISLEESIVDSPSNSPLSGLNPQNLSIESSLTHLQVISAIECAATDDNIVAIYLYQNGLGMMSAANIEEIRAALERFKLSGKQVIAYDDMFTQSEYYLASVANRISFHPQGTFDWRGTGLTTMFYKGLLDKLDIEVEIFRPTECKFKSAVEPYFLTEMSDPNRIQMTSIAESMWGTIVEDVAQSRNLNANNLMLLAEELKVNTAEDAVEYGFVDVIEYEDQVEAYLETIGVKRSHSGKLNCTSLGDYVAQHAMFDPAMNLTPTNSYVGIIYADGQIVDGATTGDGYIFGNTLADQIRRARLDDNIKSVVLRVNSPGGSALASDIIWREMTLLQQVKPVVVSMGEYAASGGYYISAPADYIFADRLTLTGSIGVFGTMFNLEPLLRTKLGITLDYAGTSPAATGINFLRELTPREKEVLNESVDRVYKVFTTIVAEGRNLDRERVLEIAEGRVWSGSQAVENRLVDANGGLIDAINKAAELADLNSGFQYKIISEPLTPFEMWLQSLGMVTAKSFGLDYSLYNEELDQFVKENIEFISTSGVQMLDPVRAKLNF